MMPKIAWVFTPLLLYGALCLLAAWRGRAPSRMALNVHISLLLLAYLLGTAGLGIFWVANQQLPVFDWHYLFGYATVLLVSLHLFFNLPVVLRWLHRRRGGEAPAGGRRLAGQAVLLLTALAGAYVVGTRQGGGELRVAAGAVADDVVAQYHAYSSESRASVFRRAPGVAWGDPPPPFKSYPGAVQVRLEKGGPARLTLAQAIVAPAPAAVLDLAALGRMLHLSAGITLERGGQRLRAAPSSGALFPSELYVAARRIDGLAAGLYHYDPGAHRLALLGPLPSASAAPQADDAEALVLLSAIFRRTGYKYRNRAYRYALADAGHLLENLRLAAHGAGMAAQLLPAFDESLAAQALAIDGVEEGVLAMVALRKAAVGLPSAGGAFAPVQPQASSALGVTGIIHQATSLQLPQEEQGAHIALPPPAPAARELFATIISRRSERRYGPGPLTLDQLSGVLADLRQPPQLFDGVRISVVVNRVTGLAPGVYRYQAAHALQLVRAGSHAAAAQSAALSQDAIGDAAAVLVLSAERARVLAGGARAYRHALIETGMMGERWLLGAVARGLSACPVGAFYDDEAAMLIGLDGSRHWVLHFAALGLPPGA
jgi:SagB-type dehydrogenase family enzyme